MELRERINFAFSALFLLESARKIRLIAVL